MPDTQETARAEARKALQGILVADGHAEDLLRWLDANPDAAAKVARHLMTPELVGRWAGEHGFRLALATECGDPNCTMFGQPLPHSEARHANLTCDCASWAEHERRYADRHDDSDAATFGDEPLTPERAAYLRGYAEGASEATRGEGLPQKFRGYDPLDPAEIEELTESPELVHLYDAHRIVSLLLAAQPGEPPGGGASVSKTCSRCGGSGRVPLSATEQLVFGLLSFEVPTLTDALASKVGLTRQRVDGALVVLEREGLASRLPRTADGYEWLAGQRR